jgi:N-hydroxyarylamine O-acetyltransferase
VGRRVGVMSADVAAYLERLGLEAEPPSVEALCRLHRAHAERVPYETLWIHMGERWGVDPVESMARIAHRRRGGYCFHLNGAFSELLRSLGYDVVRHVGGVHGPAGPTEAELTNHLVLTVRGLPAEDNPDGTWYIDVGLGDALHEPLPLLSGQYAQEPFNLVLSETTEGPGDWHLTHDPAGAFTGMAWRAAAAPMGAFAERHEWLSTSPESGFVKVLTVQRREAGAVDILRGLVLLRVGDGASEATLETEAELLDALNDVFGLDLGDDPGALRDLWTRTRATHEAWQAAGRA